MERKIKVVICEPGKQARVAEIDNTLEAMQEIVGGYIEAVYPEYNSSVALICNEEGKISGLELNRSLTDDDGEIIDIIAGTFLVVGADTNSYEFGSLTSAEEKKYMDRFNWPEKFYAAAGRLWSQEVRHA